MSVLLSVVATATAVPVPSPSPQVVQVIKEVVHTVPAVSPELMKAAQLTLLFLSGVGASILHYVLLTSKVSANVNRVIWFVLGLVVTVLAGFVSGDLQLTTSSALDFVTRLLLVLGSSQGWYQFNKFINGLGSQSEAPAVEVPAETVIPVRSTI